MTEPDAPDQTGIADTELTVPDCGASDWCAERGYSALPASPETTAAYLTDLAERLGVHARPEARKPTIGRKLAAIVLAHRVAERDPPTQQSGYAWLDRAWAGIRMDAHGRNPVQKRAATQPILSAMITVIEGEDMRALRDRALLAIGMTGALRRSKLVAIQREHIEFLPTSAARRQTRPARA